MLTVDFGRIQIGTMTKLYNLYYANVTFEVIKFFIYHLFMITDDIPIT